MKLKKNWKWKKIEIEHKLKLKQIKIENKLKLKTELLNYESQISFIWKIWFEVMKGRNKSNTQMTIKITLKNLRKNWKQIENEN